MDDSELHALESEAIQRFKAAFRNCLTTELATNLSNSASVNLLRLRIQALISIDPAPGNPLQEINLDLGHIALSRRTTDDQRLPDARQHETSQSQSEVASSQSSSMSKNISETHLGNLEVSSQDIGATSPSGQEETVLNSLERPTTQEVKKRKAVGGLRISSNKVQETQTGTHNDECIGNAENVRIAAEPKPGVRQLQNTEFDYPARKKLKTQVVYKMEPTSVEKFIAGIWAQVYGGIKIVWGFDDDLLSSYGETLAVKDHNRESFMAINTLCSKLSHASRSLRAVEIIVQTHWVDCFEGRAEAIGNEHRHYSTTEMKMCALREACAVLGWSEKELRNRLAIWRGYREIRDAGGWVALVFAGSGIYRFCKYRTGFTKELSAKLQKFRACFETAADTLHPRWRELPAIVGARSELIYPGHPHDWVVCDNADSIPLAETYKKWNPLFKFTHLEESQLDSEAWRDQDPRQVLGASSMICAICGNFQSGNVRLNECHCFLELYGGVKSPNPLQIFRTGNGKNNGLVARCNIERGIAVGEFIGSITKGLKATDVMLGGSGDRQYQIYQGETGNYTRFINHSCAPNTQFQKFIWLGIERIIIVSRGVREGSEITVDYSHRYWEELDKICLCGESCCRYFKTRMRSVASS